MENSEVDRCKAMIEKKRIKHAGSKGVSRQLSSQSSLHKYFHSKPTKFRKNWVIIKLPWYAILSDLTLFLIYVMFQTCLVCKLWWELFGSTQLIIRSMFWFGFFYFFLVHIINRIVVLDTIINIHFENCCVTVSINCLDPKIKITHT